MCDCLYIGNLDHDHDHDQDQMFQQQELIILNNQW